MAFDIFNPPVQPSVSPGGGTKITPRRIETTLGDGYSQRTGDGLNAARAMLTVTWATISWAHAETIDAFLSAHADGTPFLYRPPNETMTRLWVWKDRSRSPAFSIADSLTVTLDEVFDLG